MYSVSSSDKDWIAEDSSPSKFNPGSFLKKLAPFSDSINFYKARKKTIWTEQRNQELTVRWFSNWRNEFHPNHFHKDQNQPNLTVCFSMIVWETKEQ